MRIFVRTTAMFWRNSAYIWRIYGIDNTHNEMVMS